MRPPRAVWQLRHSERLGKRQVWRRLTPPPVLIMRPRVSPASGDRVAAVPSLFQRYGDAVEAGVCFYEHARFQANERGGVPQARGDFEVLDEDGAGWEDPIGFGSELDFLAGGDGKPTAFEGVVRPERRVDFVRINPGCGCRLARLEKTPV